MSIIGNNFPAFDQYNITAVWSIASPPVLNINGKQINNGAAMNMSAVPFASLSMPLPVQQPTPVTGQVVPPTTAAPTTKQEATLKDAFPNHPHGGPPGLIKKAGKAAAGNGSKADKADSNQTFAGALQQAGAATPGGAAGGAQSSLAMQANVLNNGVSKNLQTLTSGSAGVFA